MRGYRGAGQGSEELLLLDDDRVSVWGGDEKVLETDSSDVCTPLKMPQD